jgi:hypothetical protein
MIKVSLFISLAFNFVEPGTYGRLTINLQAATLEIMIFPLKIHQHLTLRHTMMMRRDRRDRRSMMQIWMSLKSEYFTIFLSHDPVNVADGIIF